MMKPCLLLCLILLQTGASAQDSSDVMPRTTSYENHDLMVIALAGLGILLAIYFIGRKRKK